MSDKRPLQSVVVFSAAGLLSITLAFGILLVRNAQQPDLRNASQQALRIATGQPQLLSVEPIPMEEGESCAWEPASSTTSLTSELARENEDRASAAISSEKRPIDVDRAPARVIHDPNPAFSSVAVEPESNMLVVTDENLFQVLEYNSLDNTPPTARMTEPKRVIGGILTKAEMICGAYIDPKTLDTYVVNNDTQNWLAVFSKKARGNVEPDRYLAIPHGAFGIAVDESRQELILSIQHDNSVVVFRKTASGNDKPLRVLAGDNTRLEDPHGIALDTKRNLIIVANHGNVSYRANEKQNIGEEGAEPAEVRSSTRFHPGSGEFKPPSINVYPRDAQGNVPPLRRIEGPKTRLNWPAGMTIDEERGEIYVANDIEQEISVFKVTDSGDVAPARVISGPKTAIANPTGVSLDLKRKELWVANMGNHTATVYPMLGEGNIPPLRTIRGGPRSEPSLMIGNPGAVAYDTKRAEILIPNCVAHPQIAAFSRLSKGGAAPSRLLAGQATRLSRTMHDIRYDNLHDEFLVTNPFAQAILTFSGSASGDQPPLRIIQGPSTLIGEADRLEVDPVHDEIFVPNGNRILVFPRKATGDTAPIRIIRGPDTLLHAATAMAVDPIHNLIVVGTTGTARKGPAEMGSLLVFNRTDNGNVKPLRVIHGPKAGIIRINQMVIYPPRGLIVATQPGENDLMEPEGVFVGVWNIDDNGDIAPRWRINGNSKTGMKKARGVALDPKNKEIILADMRLNAVMTYYFPEMF